ncbi:MAG: flagellar motor switch protein FliG [Spirochaetes bacterium]|jgi:flagellar motor switch protein FliG|nr:flagellar motor switch protein FliG [Spirochaetota bacterium]
MKSIDEMTGTERAAALMVALGPAAAAEIMKHLDEDSIQRISREIAVVERLTVHEREDLIGEFLIGLRKRRKNLQGGENVARELLVASFGEEKAAGILKKLTRQNLEKGFEFLAGIESETLFSFIQNEHPQTIAITLAYLPASKAAEVLQLLPPGDAKEAALRMARMEKTSPDAVLEIARVIRKKYEKLQQSGRSFEAAGGVDALVSILGHMSGDQEKKLMDHFDGSMPEISQEIRERIFTFENIANLSNQEMRALIDELHDERLIAMALKGAGDEVRFKFLRNMSRNRATDILGEIDALGAQRLSDIQEARDYIVDHMRRLDLEGTISIRKEKEKYVE